MIKKLLVFAFVTLVSSIAMQAQKSNYLPLVREGVRWHYGYFAGENNDDWFFSYEFKGDTIINGNIYKKLYRTFVDGPNNNPFDEVKPITEKTTLECCMMEKDKVVYAIYENLGKAYNMDWRFMEYYIEDPVTEYGIKLYDFNQPAESVIGLYDIQGVKCKKFATKFEYYEDEFEEMDLVEGFGYINKVGVVFSTLPHPYIPVPTCCKGWYFVKFTDTADNVIFDPYSPVTGIDDVKIGNAATDSRYYNLQGQAVDIKSAPAGIYIHNGKKIVVK